RMLPIHCNMTFLRDIFAPRMYYANPLALMEVVMPDFVTVSEGDREDKPS
ncbi:hypothetical protein CDAR_385511, partial [Caerostris darwini]